MKSELQKRLQTQEREQSMLGGNVGTPCSPPLGSLTPSPQQSYVVAGAPIGGQNFEGGALVICSVQLGFQEGQVNITEF